MNKNKEYKNVRDFLKSEGFVHGLTKYENILMKSKVYFRIPDKPSKFDKSYYQNSSVRYSGFTWLGRIVVSLILVVCVLGLALMGILTGNIKYIFDWSAYKEYEIIDDIVDEFFDGELFSKNIDSRFSGYDDIPTVLKTDEEAKTFLKYKYRYKHKVFVFDSKKYDLRKMIDGSTVAALWRMHKLDKHWYERKDQLIDSLPAQVN